MTKGIAIAAEPIREKDVSVTTVTRHTCGFAVEGDDPAKRCFDRVAAKLRALVGDECYSTWFCRLDLVELSRSIVRLSVPTAFLRSWINRHHVDLLTRLWQEEHPGILRVEIIVRHVKRAARDVAVKVDKKPTPPRQPAADARPTGTKNRLVTDDVGITASSHADFGSPLDPRNTFDTFIVGSSNRIALAAARAVVEAGSGAARFNPLFLHGAVGVGKTHLIQAVAAAALQRPERLHVVYLTAEYFMWRLATAIRDNDALSFKARLHNIDLLIIDDMQFLQGRTIQSEFGHLLNRLLDGARQIVIAADRPPHELEALNECVRSRLQRGVTLEVGAPDFEMRLEMLRRHLAAARIKHDDFNVGEDILEHVAHTVMGSGRELEGAFNQLLLRGSFEPNLSIERVDELLASLIRTTEPTRVNVEEIQSIVARHYKVSKQDLLSKRKTRALVRPRQAAMYLAKVLTTRSLPEIGRRFGGRDHTTVLHAIRKIEDLLATDSKLAQEIETLKRLIQ